MANLETVLYSVNRRKIETAYSNYIDKTEGAEGAFFGVITEFAKRKVTKAVFDVPDGSSTVDDHAQDVAVYVWSNLHKFKGKPESFYLWLYRICHARGIDAFQEITQDQVKFVPLQVEDENGDLDDNPETYKEYKQEYIRKLPDWIQGTDLWICNLIRENKTYTEIGEFLHITEENVKQRANRMRKRNLEEAAKADRVKRVRVKGKWIDAIPKNTKEQHAKS